MYLLPTTHGTQNSKRDFYPPIRLMYHHAGIIARVWFSQPVHLHGLSRPQGPPEAALSENIAPDVSWTETQALGPRRSATSRSHARCPPKTMSGLRTSSPPWCNQLHLRWSWHTQGVCQKLYLVSFGVLADGYGRTFRTISS
jgi:hypothetical protein